MKVGMAGAECWVQGSNSTGSSRRNGSFTLADPDSDSCTIQILRERDPNPDLNQCEKFWIILCSHRVWSPNPSPSPSPEPAMWISLNGKDESTGNGDLRVTSEVPLLGFMIISFWLKFQRKARDIFVLAWYLSIIIYNSTISRPPEWFNTNFPANFE